jgi:hypothetical protein
MLSTIGVGLTLMVPAGFASTLLAPNSGTATLTNNGNLPTSGLLATGTFLLTNSLNPAQTATVVEDVYSTNTGLDFFYQVKNTSTTVGGHTADPFNEVSLDFYSNAIATYMTSVAYDTNGCTPGTTTGTCAVPTNAPGANLASRSGGGDTINFFFTSSSQDGQLMVGQTSAWLEVDTNAFSYDSLGEIGVIDGGTASSAGFEPSGSVPEPATMALLGGGLALLGVARWRKAARKA